MPEKIEKFIKTVYEKWKNQQPQAQGVHPDEEDIACFLENKLSDQECETVKNHLIHCDRCAEIVAIQLALKPARALDVPRQLVARVKDLARPQEQIPALQICLRLREKILEILNTTGNVLVGQELVPAPVLRSRKINEFKDEVTVLKEFAGMRVEVKILSQEAGVFSLIILATEKTTQKIMKDLRFTLIREGLEMESYLSSLGKVTFEHVLLGKYTVEISTIESKLASILLDIRV